MSLDQDHGAQAPHLAIFTRLAPSVVLLVVLAGSIEPVSAVKVALLLGLLG